MDKYFSDSSEFQRAYISYLEEQNNNLVNKVMLMKEIMDRKTLNQDSNMNFDSLLEEILVRNENF